MSYADLELYKRDLFIKVDKKGKITEFEKFNDLLKSANDAKLLLKRVKKTEYGPDNCKIELLEAFPCNSIDEIRKRESYYIHTINSINNYHNWTPERIEQKEEKDKIENKIYYDNHKEKIKEKYEGESVL